MGSPILQVTVRTSILQSNFMTSTTVRHTPRQIPATNIQKVPASTIKPPTSSSLPSTNLPIHLPTLGPRNKFKSKSQEQVAQGRITPQEPAGSKSYELLFSTFHRMGIGHMWRNGHIIREMESGGLFWGLLGFSGGDYVTCSQAPQKEGPGHH